MAAPKWFPAMASTESARGSRRANGFTLIEAVVALLIVSLGMTAVFMQLNQYATGSIYLQEKTIASWIGSNVITELSVGADWPETGHTELDEFEFASREWFVTIDVTETEIENLRRADVDVALADRPERVIHTVSGLIEPPVPQGMPPVNFRTVIQDQQG